MQSLRTFSEPFYTMTCVLDGTDYLFEFRHNQREDCWYFSVATTDGEPLASGVKIVSDRFLLARFADVRLPPGRLVAISNTTDKSPPRLDELGEDRRVTLIYFTLAELTA